MIRTQIYLTEEEKEALEKLSAESGKKQSELIRNAVDRLIDQSSEGNRKRILEHAAGMWKNRKDLPDFAGLRKSWDRGS